MKASQNGSPRRRSWMILQWLLGVSISVFVVGCQVGTHKRQALKGVTNNPLDEDAVGASLFHVRPYPGCTARLTFVRCAKAPAALFDTASKKPNTLQLETRGAGINGATLELPPGTAGFGEVSDLDTPGFVYLTDSDAFQGLGTPSWYAAESLAWRFLGLSYSEARKRNDLMNTDRVGTLVSPPGKKRGRAIVWDHPEDPPCENFDVPFCAVPRVTRRDAGPQMRQVGAKDQRYWVGHTLLPSFSFIGSERVVVSAARPDWGMGYYVTNACVAALTLLHAQARVLQCENTVDESLSVYAPESITQTFIAESLESPRLAVPLPNHELARAALEMVSGETMTGRSFIRSFADVDASTAEYSDADLYEAWLPDSYSPEILLDDAESLRALNAKFQSDVNAQDEQLRPPFFASALRAAAPDFTSWEGGSLLSGKLPPSVPLGFDAAFYSRRRATAAALLWTMRDHYVQRYFRHEGFGEAVNGTRWGRLNTFNARLRPGQAAYYFRHRLFTETDKRKVVRARRLWHVRFKTLDYEKAERRNARVEAQQPANTQAAPTAVEK